MSDPERSLSRFLVAAGLTHDPGAARWTPVSGGVSSDIWRVAIGSREICVKRALPKLRVAAEWHAPVGRNATEWAYIETVNAIFPGAVPAPLAHDPAAGLFAMEWLSPDRHPLWKAELFAHRVDVRFAASVGELIGRIHSLTADETALARRFDTDDAFHSLRVEPYLLTTAVLHSSVKAQIMQAVEQLTTTRRVLVHGDLSPKNILSGPRGPVLLDAEVAWFGDPSFDLAFCLNHLVIKRRAMPQLSGELDRAIAALAAAYLPHVTWEDPANVERRTAQLLPMLALARVDGKSPVDYLTESQRDALRRVALDCIRDPREGIQAACRGLSI